MLQSNVHKTVYRGDAGGVQLSVGGAGSETK